MNPQQAGNREGREGRSVYVWLAWSLFVIVHGWLFLIHRAWPVLGFDTGFYRRYLLEPLSSIPHAAVPGLDHTVIFPRIILDIFRLLPFPTDWVLYGAYFAILGFFGWAFYRWVAEIFGSKAALISYCLILLSPVYFHAYWYFLLKNFLALGLFFLLLLAFRQQRKILVLVLSLLIPITHQSTTVVVILVLALLVLLSLLKRESWRLPLLSLSVMTVLYLWFHPSVATKLASPPTAVFLDWQTFLLYSWPVLALSVLAISRYGRGLLKSTDLISVGAVVTIFVVFLLPYHERLFLLLLLILAIVAGYELAKTRGLAAATLLVAVAVWSGYQMRGYQPLIDGGAANQLEALQVLNGKDSVIVPNYLAPWVHGYTVAEVYAPGVFKDRFQPYDWDLYWSHAVSSYDQAFLDSFPQPLYFFVPETANQFLPVTNCVKKIEGYLYQYSCYNKTHENLGPAS